MKSCGERREQAAIGFGIETGRMGEMKQGATGFPVEVGDGAVRKRKGLANWIGHMMGSGIDGIRLCRACCGVSMRCALCGRRKHL